MILSLIAGLFLSIILIWVIKEILSYKNLKFYEKQGMATRYKPVAGIYGYFDLSPNSPDIATDLKTEFDNLVEKNEILVVN